jgi:hypothetical protein
LDAAGAGDGRQEALNGLLAPDEPCLTHRDDEKLMCRRDWNFESTYYLNWEGVVHTLLRLNGAPGMAWTRPYHNFGWGMGACPTGVTMLQPDRDLVPAGLVAYTLDLVGDAVQDAEKAPSSKCPRVTRETVEEIANKVEDKIQKTFEGGLQAWDKTQTSKGKWTGGELYKYEYDGPDKEGGTERAGKTEGDAPAEGQGAETSEKEESRHAEESEKEPGRQLSKGRSVVHIRLNSLLKRRRAGEWWEMQEGRTLLGTRWCCTRKC